MQATLTPKKAPTRTFTHSRRRVLEVHTRHARQDREEFRRVHVNEPRTRELIHHLRTGEWAIGLV